MGKKRGRRIPLDEDDQVIPGPAVEPARGKEAKRYDSRYELPAESPEQPCRDTVIDHPVTIDAGVRINGDLAVPDQPVGAVVFAHGSGSSRHSSRNRMVAAHLQGLSLATLLIDLLTEEEELEDLRTRHLRFDVTLLARRLTAAADWMRSSAGLGNLALGYFGASTGAGAALIAAADQPEGAGAVVSRGGRPDLAAERLPEVKAPTLLIVGGADTAVLDLNRQAQARIQAPSELKIVPGASHLFEEPGALQAVANIAGDWFLDHLGPRSQRRSP